jgi:hypothetical protein
MRVIFLPPHFICCGNLCTNLSLVQRTFSLVYGIYWRRRGGGGGGLGGLKKNVVAYWMAKT